jgi:hypothetical protein
MNNFANLQEEMPADAAAAADDDDDDDVVVDERLHAAPKGTARSCRTCTQSATYALAIVHFFWGAASLHSSTACLLGVFTWCVSATNALCRSTHPFLGLALVQ